ncbi:hypothetical protein H4R34_001833 [Dimargaris verticillata]|uniref:Uncharacterized protein n=1 Tax=Dimargaris verticillata TaxID=2761393 RepID=A0A9W8EE49_9FUNG|nr:hypothetical protein H4R34_001833 [Dimargaris verticillata]
MKATSTAFLVAAVAVSVTYTTVDAAPSFSQFRSSGSRQTELSVDRAAELNQKANDLDPSQLKAFLNKDAQERYNAKPIPLFDQPLSQQEYEHLKLIYSAMNQGDLENALAKEQGRFAMIKNRAKKPVHDLAKSVLARVTPYKAKVDDFYASLHPQQVNGVTAFGDDDGSYANEYYNGNYQPYDREIPFSKRPDHWETSSRISDDEEAMTTLSRLTGASIGSHASGPGNNGVVALATEKNDDDSEILDLQNDTEDEQPPMAHLQLLAPPTPVLGLSVDPHYGSLPRHDSLRHNLPSSSAFGPGHVQAIPAQGNSDETYTGVGKHHQSDLVPITPLTSSTRWYDQSRITTVEDVVDDESSIFGDNVSVAPSSTGTMRGASN